MTSGAPARPRNLVRRIVVGAVVLAVAALGIYTPAVLFAPLPAASATVAVPAVTPAAAAVLALPGVGSSAIALKGSSEFLGTSGQTGPIPTASMAKILTTLVVLGAKPLAVGEQGPNITMTDQDAQILQQTIAVDGSWENVVVGQVLSERQVLEIMLLKSANNYSETVTNWAFGSFDNYLAAANKFIAAHGLHDTTVVDTSGLNPGTQSSTKDLLAIASLALDNPVLAQIVSTKSEDFPELGTLDNTNALLGVDGIDGMKTGTTDEAGSCLLFSADFAVADKNFTVVGVVQGAATGEDARAAVSALLASAKKGFSSVSLVKKGDEFGRYSTAWGDSADIVAAEDASKVVWSNTAIDAKAETKRLTLAKKGDDIGDVDFTLDDGQTAEVPLELDAPISDPGPMWKFFHPASLFG